VGAIALAMVSAVALLASTDAIAGGRYAVGVGVGFGGAGYRGYVGYGTGGWGGYRPAGYWTGYRPGYWGGGYYRPAYWGGYYGYRPAYWGAYWGPGWGWGSYWGPGPYWGGYWGPAYLPSTTVVTVPTSPPVYIEQQTAPPVSTGGSPFETGWWYYCKNPAGYYPYVERCPDGWTKVPPRPADAPQ
jgi:hypothetical protein